jgi:hypothetical protein
MCLFVDVQISMCECIDVQICRFICGFNNRPYKLHQHMCEFADVQICRCANVPMCICRCANVPMCKYPDVYAASCWPLHIISVPHRHFAHRHRHIIIFAHQHIRTSAHRNQHIIIFAHQHIICTLAHLHIDISLCTAFLIIA